MRAARVFALLERVALWSTVIAVLVGCDGSAAGDGEAVTGDAGKSAAGDGGELDAADDARDNAAAQDWQNRISGPGVVWYHNFEREAEVDNFRWRTGFGQDPTDSSGSPDTVRLVPDDGFAGGGSLEIYRAAGTLDSSVWWRPLSPLTGAGNGRGQDDPGAGTIAPVAFNPVPSAASSSSGTITGAFDNKGYYGAHYPANPAFDGSEFYLQMRVKIDPARSDPTNPAGGKSIIFTNNEQSLSSQQIVVQSRHRVSSEPQTNFFMMNHSGGKIMYDDTPGLGQHPNTEYGPGDGVCSMGADPAARAKCWRWPAEPEWVTVLFHVIPGHTGQADTTFEVWIAEEGDTEYTLIWSQDAVDIDFGTGDSQQEGYNALLLIHYPGGPAGVDMGVGSYHRYTQIILSTEHIPCPQVW